MWSNIKYPFTHAKSLLTCVDLKLKSDESFKTKVHINRTKTKLTDYKDVLTINAKYI